MLSKNKDLILKGVDTTFSALQGFVACVRDAETTKGLPPHAEAMLVHAWTAQLRFIHNALMNLNSVAAGCWDDPAAAVEAQRALQKAEARLKAGDRHVQVFHREAVNAWANPETLDLADRVARAMSALASSLNGIRAVVDEEMTIVTEEALTCARE